MQNILLQNCFFINLKHRTDRLEHVLLELKKIGIVSPTRVNATTHEMGIVGCCLSHIRCIELAIARDLPHVLIVEDDVTFTNPHALLAKLRDFQAKVKNWDVCLLGANNYKPFKVVSSSIIRVGNAQTTTAYIVRRHYYHTLLGNFKDGLRRLLVGKNLTVHSLDIWWKRLQRQHRWFMLVPASVTQWATYSDIEKKQTDYTALMLKAI